MISIPDYDSDSEWWMIIIVIVMMNDYDSDNELLL